MDQKAEFKERLPVTMAKAWNLLRPIVLAREFNCHYWGRPVTLEADCCWLRGEAISALEKLWVLADWLGIEPQVLCFGERVVPSVRAKQKRREEAVTGPKREVILALAKVSR